MRDVKGKKNPRCRRPETAGGKGLWEYRDGGKWEIPGWRKGWQSEGSFSTLSTAPWESRQRAMISTFPPPGFAPDGKVQNQKRVFHFPTQGSRPRSLFPPSKPKMQRTKSAAAGPPPPRFQDHSALERVPISGSFLHSKMLLGCGLRPECGVEHGAQSAEQILRAVRLLDEGSGSECSQIFIAVG